LQEEHDEQAHENTCSGLNDRVSRLRLNRRQNAEADQRRTMDSASPLDSIRRLIQRLVISALATPMDRGRRT
jgi:hypothetical protein